MIFSLRQKIFCPQDFAKLEVLIANRRFKAVIKVYRKKIEANCYAKNELIADLRKLLEGYGVLNEFEDDLLCLRGVSSK